MCIRDSPEVVRYEKAAAYLAKHPDDKDSTQKELQEEQEKLVGGIAGLKEPLTCLLYTSSEWCIIAPLVN